MFSLKLVFAGILSSSGSAASAVYKEDEAIRHYKYALVSFCNQSAIQDWSCGSLCGQLPRPSHTRYVGPGKYYAVRGYAALLPVPGRACIVGFRGTAPKSLGNIMADVQYFPREWPRDSADENTSWCQDCRVHRGFVGAYHELRVEMHAAIADLGCTSVVFVGHSLGAAVAAFASVDTRRQSKVKVPSVWTYGMPRIGNRAFVKAYVQAALQQSVVPPMWRVVHYHDLFPRLSNHWTNLFTWEPRHVPLEVYYDREDFTPGSFKLCPPAPGDPSAENVSCSFATPFWDMRHFPPLQWNASDHMSYLGIDFLKEVGPECGWDQGNDNFVNIMFNLILEPETYVAGVLALVLALVLMVSCCAFCGVVCRCRQSHSPAQGRGRSVGISDIGGPVREPLLVSS